MPTFNAKNHFDPINLVLERFHNQRENLDKISQILAITGLFFGSTIVGIFSANKMAESSTDDFAFFKKNYPKYSRQYDLLAKSPDKLKSSSSSSDSSLICAYEFLNKVQKLSPEYKQNLIDFIKDESAKQNKDIIDKEAKRFLSSTTTDIIQLPNLVYLVSIYLVSTTSINNFSVSKLDPIVMDLDTEEQILNIIKNDYKGEKSEVKMPERRLFTIEEDLIKKYYHSKENSKKFDSILYTSLFLFGISGLGLMGIHHLKSRSIKDLIGMSIFKFNNHIKFFQQHETDSVEYPVQGIGGVKFPSGNEIYANLSNLKKLKEYFAYQSNASHVNGIQALFLQTLAKGNKELLTSYLAGNAAYQRKLYLSFIKMLTDCLNALPKEKDFRAHHQLCGQLKEAVQNELAKDSENYSSIISQKVDEWWEQQTTDFRITSPIKINDPDIAPLIKKLESAKNAYLTILKKIEESNENVNASTELVKLCEESIDKITRHTLTGSSLENPRELLKLFKKILKIISKSHNQISSNVVKDKQRNLNKAFEDIKQNYVFLKNEIEKKDDLWKKGINRDQAERELEQYLNNSNPKDTQTRPEPIHLVDDNQNNIGVINSNKY